MFGKFKIAAASALIALGSLAALPSTASAGDIDVDVYFGGGVVGVGHGFGGGHGGGYDDYRPRCSPWKAEAKANRMGLRRTRVADVSRNRIVVRGWRWGERQTVVFGRAPNCPVRGVR